MAKSSPSLAVEMRPKTIDQLVGQDDAKDILRPIFEGKKSVPGAFLIVGPTGLGKTTTGRIIARTINCLHKKHNGCGKCESCEVFDTDPDNHPDFYEENAANARGIDDIRALINMAGMQPRFRRRFLMADECHQWTPQSMQAMLKTTEEPPADTSYILATTDPQKLPETLRKRCTMITLKPVTTAQQAERLHRIAKYKDFKIKEKDCETIAKYSRGFMREGIATLDQLMTLMISNPKKKPRELIERAYFATEDKEAIDTAMAILISIYEGNTATVIKYLAEAPDLFNLVQRLDWMNLYCIFALIGSVDKGVKNPQPYTPDNRLVWKAISGSLEGKKGVDKDKVTEMLRRAVELTTRLKNFRADITTISGQSALSLGISSLAGPL